MENKERQAYNFFISKGWTPAQSAGIVANLKAESGFQTTAHGDVGYKPKTTSGVQTVGSHGIAQWNGDRLLKLKNMYGNNWTNFYNQLEFVDWELNNTHKTAGNNLRKAKTAEQAADIVVRQYEIPKDKDGASRTRQAYSKDIYYKNIGSSLGKSFTAMPNMEETVKGKIDGAFKSPGGFSEDRIRTYRGPNGESTIFGDFDEDMEESDYDEYNEYLENYLYGENEEEEVGSGYFLFGDEEETQRPEQEDQVTEEEQEEVEEEDIDFNSYYTNLMSDLDSRLSHKEDMANSILGTFSDFDYEADQDQIQYTFGEGGEMKVDKYLKTLTESDIKFNEEMGEEYSNNSYEMFNLIQELNEE